MNIQQFEDKFLSHYSYAIVDANKIVLIDPSRDPQPYYEFAKQHGAKIIAVIETHLHADFISSHVEIANTTGAQIFIHPSAKPEFAFQPFDDDAAEISLGRYSLKAMHTPGHSPDSICILLKDESQKITTIFTGDTLFIGDVGRPDLRETTFTQDAARQKLARQMYHSLHEKVMKLRDDVIVFPAHGSGSLCGKNLSSHPSSTIGAERMSNVSLQSMSKDAFVEMLLADQPMVPKYFPHSVAINRKKDIPTFGQAIQNLNTKNSGILSDKSIIIDTRPAEDFKKSHLKNSINIPGDKKFETWLGTLIAPDEDFLITGDTQDTLQRLAERIVKIGYDANLKGFINLVKDDKVQSSGLNISEFETHQYQYTIVDVRNYTERRSLTVFENSIHIPLQQLRERISEIPKDKPIVTHCGGGNRGAMAASILELSQDSVYDLGAEVKRFGPAKIMS